MTKIKQHCHSERSEESLLNPSRNVLPLAKNFTCPQGKLHFSKTFPFFA
jgi:hypothetical protein